MARNEFKKALNILEKSLQVETDTSERAAHIYCATAQAYFGLNEDGTFISRHRSQQQKVDEDSDN